jgi:hypothetical protein
VLGVPLIYVIRHILLPKEDDEDPAFGEDDSKYTSHDHEMITCCPILMEDCDYDLSYDVLKIQGPFVPTFLTDSKKVWAILHMLFSTSSIWQNVKKFTATQDGRRVYPTLHSHFFGKDKVNTMRNDIHSSLKSKIYQGDQKNFNFDKYCLLHVAEHNRYTSLVEYGVHPLEESMKILYFEDGINDPTLDAALNAILVNRSQFQDFDSVRHMYVTKRSQKSEAGILQGQQLSAVTGRGGGQGAVGPATVVAVGATPKPNGGGLFLRPKLTWSLLSRTSITPKKCMPSSQRPRRLSTGSSGNQERNVAPVLPHHWRNHRH